MNKKDNWEPHHRSCSHPGLISLPLSGSDHWQSVTQSTYVPLKHDTKNSKGARTRLLEKFFWDELTEQAYREMIAPPPVEEYVTEYEDEYNITDFKPSTEIITKDSELHQKYPLYSDPPLTFWQDNRKTIFGVTKVINPNNPFRKNGQFSKPLTEVLDEPLTGVP